jgi:hypothetical protein
MGRPGPPFAWEGSGGPVRPRPMDRARSIGPKTGDYVVRNAFGLLGSSPKPPQVIRAGHGAKSVRRGPWRLPSVVHEAAGGIPWEPPQSGTSLEPDCWLAACGSSTPAQSRRASMPPIAREAFERECEKFSAPPKMAGNRRSGGSPSLGSREGAPEKRGEGLPVLSPSRSKAQSHAHTGSTWATMSPLGFGPILRALVHRSVRAPDCQRALRPLRRSIISATIWACSRPAEVLPGQLARTGSNCSGLYKSAPRY